MSALSALCKQGLHARTDYVGNRKGCWGTARDVVQTARRTEYRDHPCACECHGKPR